MIPNPSYLGAIALHLKDSFPNSKIDVWSEESMFMNGYIAIMARVDNVTAYTTLNPEIWVSEWHVSDILVGEIKEILDER